MTIDVDLGSWAHSDPQTVLPEAPPIIYGCHDDNRVLVVEPQGDSFRIRIGDFDTEKVLSVKMDKRQLSEMAESIKRYLLGGRLW